jgi:hypothetical protein
LAQYIRNSIQFYRGKTLKLRRDSLLAWTLFAIISAAALISLADDLASRPVNDNIFKVAHDLVWGSLPVVFAFLAALIASRQRRNVIGWLMMIPASLVVGDVITTAILEQYPVAPAEPGVALFLAVWFENASWLLLIFPLFFTMLLFPDGRPPSPRWRWILVTGVGMCLIFLLLGMFTPTLNLIENSDWVMDNPIYLQYEIEFPFVLWSAALVIVTLFCVAAPFVRYHRAAGVEREQIKWLFYACGLFALVYVPGVGLSQEIDSILNDAWSLLFSLAILAVPAAITGAILRFRLYDIDLIIRKTLVYGVLTGLLAIVYFGTVVLLQTIFDAITGQSSPVIIVISTLTIAALFAPLRQRVQTTINKRFFRQKYDAQKVLAQFAVTARDEVDLDTLTADLLKAVQETMEPEKVALWFKKANL